MKLRYPECYLEGILLYQQGEYWLSHEAWEDLWRESTGTERDFYQGLVQLDAALIHTRKGNWLGVASLLGRSLSHLERCPSWFMGIDIDGLRQAMGRYLAEVKTLAEGTKKTFDWSLAPRLRLRGIWGRRGEKRHAKKFTAKEIPMAQLTKVAETTEIPPGQGKCVEVGGQRVAVFNVDGTYYAIDENCTHVGGPLSEGDLEEALVTCPWHGAQFDVTSGKCVRGPAKNDVKSYKVHVEGNAIKLEG